MTARTPVHRLQVASNLYQLIEDKVLPGTGVNSATFWKGSLLGGLIFGIGMVFAGGCASGSLWRMGEGHLKLWVTMFFFSWMGSTASAIFKKLGLTSIDESNVETWEMTKVGFQAYFPEMIGGWGWTLLIGGALLSAAGGNAGYEYSIDNGTTWQASNIFNTGPGNFTITVRDSKNCTTSFPTTVVLGNNFTLTPQTDAVICEGASTQLELISNATQYSWSPVTGLSNATIPNPVANPTITTQYTVTATSGDRSPTSGSGSDMTSPSRRRTPTRRRRAPR